MTTENRTAAATATLISAGLRHTTKRGDDQLASGGSEIADTTNFNNIALAYSNQLRDAELTDIYTVGGSPLTFYPTIAMPLAPSQSGVTVNAAVTVTVQRLDVVR